MEVVAAARAGCDSEWEERTMMQRSGISAEGAEGRAVVEEFWRRMDAADFESAGALLHDDYVGEWPQSRERIRGRANFIAINAHYPGRWRIALKTIVAEGDRVATEVVLFNAESGRRDRAVSLFELRDRRIASEVDYWPEPYDAPAWRAEWVERGEEG
jgi:ketosteroid isomerase-like protein